MSTKEKPGTEWVQALADISHSGYVVTATKPVHWLQIRPIVHNYPYHSPRYIRVRAVVWEWCEGQTDTPTRVTNIHFASSTTHAKC